jgi:hypothetical protein
MIQTLKKGKGMDKDGKKGNGGGGKNKTGGGRY